MVTTKDSKFIYVSDWNGRLIKICIENNKEVKRFGKITSVIYALDITPNNNFLFIGGQRRRLYQYSVSKDI